MFSKYSLPIEQKRKPTMTNTQFAFIVHQQYVVLSYILFLTKATRLNALDIIHYVTETMNTVSYTLNMYAISRGKTMLPHHACTHILPVCRQQCSPSSCLVVTTLLENQDA